MNIQNPVPAAVRFLQNFPGMCQRATTDIKNALKLDPQERLKFNSNSVDECKAGIMVSFIGTALVGYSFLVPNFTTGARIVLSGGGAAFLAAGVYFANTLRNLGQQAHEPNP